MLAGMVVGAGMGLGLLLVARGLYPPRRPLSQALAELTSPPKTTTAPGAGTRARAAVQVAALLQRAGVDLTGADADLRVAGRTLEQHLVDKLLAVVAGLLFPPAAVIMLRLGGVDLPLSSAAAPGLMLAAAGFVLPDVQLRNTATKRRRTFRYALSSYLDLAHILLAASSGTETALKDAADAGEGWVFTELRAVLLRCQRTGDSPWNALHQLGEDLDLPELREAATSLELAGSHGAQVRASLAARAKTLRDRDLTDMRAQADTATERMTVPAVGMLMATVLFLGYPVATAILAF